MFKGATCFPGFLMDKRLSHEFMISGYHIVIDSGNLSVIGLQLPAASAASL